MSVDISVVIISYNQREYITDALDSVLEQTRRPTEIIVCDDCSTDGTAEIIEEYAERYPGLVRPILHEENKGIAGNLNSGLRAVEGDVFTVLAGDDRFLPRKLEREFDCIQENGADVVFSDYYETDPEGNRLRRGYGDQTPPCGDVFIDVFARDFWFRSWMQTTASLERVGLFDEEFALYGDWDFTIRLANEYEIVYVPEPLEEYRIHDSSVERTTDIERKVEHVRKAYEKNEHLLENRSSAEQQYVRDRLDEYFTKQRVALQLQGREGVNRYVTYLGVLRSNPKQVINIRSHLEYLLPEPAFRLVKRFYNQVGGRS